MMKHRAVFWGLIALCSNALWSQNSNSNQQALEQLKILQNRFEQKPPDAATNTFSPLSSGLTDNKANDSQQQVNPPSVSVAPQAVSPPAPLAPSGPITSSSDDNVINELAYEQVENQIFPMSEKEVVTLHKKYQDIELAKVTNPRTPPKPVATSQFVNLSPGSTPPVIRLSQGFVSSLVFLDSTGAPWPISAYDLGDPTAFNIQWDKTSNTLMIQALKLYNYGNLAVRLEGLNTPVMLTLIPGQRVVDYRMDMRVQGYGPNAQMPTLGDGLPPSANKVLLHVLDGVPPIGSKRLTISGGDARAWMLQNKMYIRTNLTILSPAWLATMTSADGMHAYEIQKSPVLLVSWHGKVMQLKVEGL